MQQFSPEFLANLPGHVVTSNSMAYGHGEFPPRRHHLMMGPSPSMGGARTPLRAYSPDWPDLPEVSSDADLPGPGESILCQLPVSTAEKLGKKHRPTQSKAGNRTKATKMTAAVVKATEKKEKTATTKTKKAEEGDK